MTTPTIEQVMQWGQQADKIAKPLTLSWDIALCEIARADLEATIEEQKAEIDRLGKLSEKRKQQLQKFDDVIDELGVAVSCINPVEDLKRAISALIGQRDTLKGRVAQLKSACVYEAKQWATWSAEKTQQLATLQSKAGALADVLQKASATFNDIEGAHSTDRLICREAAQNIEVALATYKESKQ